jgi:aspartate 1-decarboxylase
MFFEPCGEKMLRHLLRAKIHRATVTGADLDYEGSIALDVGLMEAAGLVPFEAVHVWNISNGERLVTYVIPGKRGSGEVVLNGAAARRVQKGDLIIVAAFCWVDERELSVHAARVVLVDARNRPLPPVVTEQLVATGA